MRCTFKQLKLISVAAALCLCGSLKAEKLPEIESAAVTQQNVKVTGTVVDANGPIIGASVVEKGTTNGTTTDTNGRFNLSGVKNGAIIQVTYLGYATQEITFRGQSELEITLVEDSQTLGEVVVTALGIKRESKALGYAVSTINSDDLVRVGAPNFATALYGKAAGVRIQAAPGGNTSAVSMTVRGLSSITGNTQPLLILDGVPIRNGNANNGEDENKTSRGWDNGHVQGNGIIDINPEDVESISILKGAAATALYGSEAANGVVLVTSKKNRGTGVKIDFNATLTGNFIAYLPKVQTEFGPGVTTMNRGNYELQTGGFVERAWNGKTYNSIYAVDDGNATQNFGPRYDGSDVLYYDGTVRKYNSQTDSPWGEVFRNGFNQNYNLALAYGSEKSNVRFSYTHVKDLPNQIRSDYSKHNFNLVGSLKVIDKVNLEYTANYIRQNVFNRPMHMNWMHNSFSGIAGSFADFGMLMNKTVTSLGYKNVVYDSGNPNTLTPNESFAFPIPYNAVLNEVIWPMKTDQQTENNSRFIASVAPSWEIINGLTLRGRLSTDLTADHMERNRRTTEPLELRPNSESGGFETMVKKYEIYYGDIMLMYAKDLTEDIGLTANAGFQGRQERTDAMYMRTEKGLSVENWFNIKASRATPKYIVDKNEFLKTAWFGSLGFSFFQSVYIDGTVRQEKTSTLRKGNNTFFYPSISGSWVYTDTFRDAMPSWYDFGKVRMSYGVVGNAPEVYAANVAYNQSTEGGYTYTQIPGTYGNDDIRPETKYEYEIGLESKFFKNRLGLEVSYYNNRVVDQILPVTLPRSAGAESVLMNIGELKNYGVEFTLNATPVIVNDFRWDLRFNYAFNRNEVVKLNENSSYINHSSQIDDGGNQNVQLWSFAGRPMGDIYANAPIMHSSGKYLVSETGMYQIETATDKKKLIGNALPDGIGGFGSTLTYKNLSLDFLLDFRIGGMVMNWNHAYSMSQGTNTESLTYRDEAHGGLAYYFEGNVKEIGKIKAANHSDARGPNGEVILHDGVILDGVTADGKANTQIIPVSRYYNGFYGWGGSAYFGNSIFDNSYLKLRELSLSYRIPSSVCPKIGCKNMSVSVFGRNLFYIYKNMPMYDAEATDGTSWVKQAQIGGATATTRTIGASLRINF